LTQGMDEEVKLFYDLTAGKTADEWYENAVLMPSIQEFIAMLPGNPRVLDLGCGPGHESMRLTKAGARVVGVDFSQESIRIARQHSLEAHFELMDFRHLDRERLGVFDGVFACASLIHISPRELLGVWEQVRGILTQDGLVLVMLREGEGFFERWPVIDGKKLHRVIYLYTQETLSAAATGFEYIKAGYLSGDQFEKGWRSHIFQRIS